MKRYVLLIHGLVSGVPSEHAGQYLRRFDFEGCALDEAILESVPNPAHARHFRSIIEATEMWKTVDWRTPRRADGKPNRPLTAFTVTVEPYPRT